MAEITIRDVSKSFRDTPVLGGVSLDVADGEFLTLVGPSGCGKTTLLRVIAGLETQDAGTVSIGGAAVDDLPPKSRDVAMVFQSYALYPYMSVAENLALPLVMRRLSAAQRLPLVGRHLPGARAALAGIEAEVRAVASSLSIEHLLARRPGQLSGGQRQRVALGRAMVRRPQAFLMDEPLSNLDAKLRVQARAEIAELHARLGATFVYVTHDQTEAMTLSDRVAVMLGGRLLQVAPPQEVYDDPASLDVARFIGTPEINRVPARVGADGLAEVAGRSWPVALGAPVGAAVTLAIRPEALALDTGAPDRTPPLAGVVRRLELLGSETLVYASVEGLSEPLVMRVEPGLGAGLPPGTAVALSADPARALAFDAEGRRLAHRSRASAPARPRLAGGAHG